MLHYAIKSKRSRVTTKIHGENTAIGSRGRTLCGRHVNKKWGSRWRLTDEPITCGRCLANLRRREREGR